MKIYVEVCANPNRRRATAISSCFTAQFEQCLNHVFTVPENLSVRQSKNSISYQFRIWSEFRRKNNSIWPFFVFFSLYVRPFTVD